MRWDEVLIYEIKYTKSLNFDNFEGWGSQDIAISDHDPGSKSRFDRPKLKISKNTDFGTLEIILSS